MFTKMVVLLLAVVGLTACATQQLHPVRADSAKDEAITGALPAASTESTSTSHADMSWLGGTWRGQVWHTSWPSVRPPAELFVASDGSYVLSFTSRTWGTATGRGKLVFVDGGRLLLKGVFTEGNGVYVGLRYDYTFQRTAGGQLMGGGFGPVNWTQYELTKQ